MAKYKTIPCIPHFRLASFSSPSFNLERLIPARGVHRSRTGPDRPGPKTEMGEGCGPRTGQCPDRTDQGPAFCLAADRVVARSARATRHGRAT